jgi:hypothetical protein
MVEQLGRLRIRDDIDVTTHVMSMARARVELEPVASAPQPPEKRALFLFLRPEITGRPAA